jgi:hypothetical protein
MLSPDLRTRELYSDFMVNDNYTLDKDGCWKVYQIVTSTRQQDGVTWNVGVELQYYPSCSKRWIWFYWNVHIRIITGQAMIVTIGLYPTGTGN